MSIDASQKTPKERSPSFPFIPLATAIQRLEQFEAYFGRHAAKAAQVGLAWQMKPNSSQAQQTVAAIKAFGFVEYEGSSEARTAKLSDLARTYLRAQQESVKSAALKKAALQPKAIAAFFSKWGTDRPPDPVCLDELILEHRFTDAAARLFLKVYDETLGYAGLSDSDKIPVDDPLHDGASAGKGAKQEIGDETDPPNSFKAGDLVQREVAGQLTFPAPRKVTQVFFDKAHGWMVSVDGYNGAFPMNEIVQAKSTAPAAPAMGGVGAVAATDPAASTQHDVSKDPIETFLSNGRLQINANVGLDGIKRLKQMLDKYEELIKLMN